MIILDDTDHSSPPKSVRSQSGVLTPQSEPAREAPAGPDSLPPPYSRPTAPAPVPQHTSSPLSGSPSQGSEDVEANGHEHRHHPRKRRARRWAKHVTAITLVSLVFVTAWRFVLLEGWEHHIARIWSSSSQPPFRDHKHHHPPPFFHPTRPDQVRHVSCPPRFLFYLPPNMKQPSDVSEIAKDIATLQRFCTTKAPWTPTVLHPKEHIPFNVSSTSIHLPIHASSLFVLVRVPNASGKLQILQSPSSTDPPKVFVTAHHPANNSLQSVSACLMEKLPGVVGVGLFKDELSLDEPLDFDITLFLPTSPQSDFSYDLQTDLPKFAQMVDVRLPTSLVHLKSRGMPVTGNIQARELIIETSHAPVQGVMKASEALSIKTSHSPIDVNVTLESDDSSFTSIEFENTASSINARVALISSADEGGKYEVEVTAPHTALNLTFPSAPVNSVLRLESVTTENPCHIVLPPQYEGSFSLTSLGGHSPSIMPRTGTAEQFVESVSSDSQREVIRGRISSAEGELQGWVNVTTSRAGNVLVV
ncbi:hypothetical protein V5O48_007148 [Marasmius crinis-equi]|uniref:Adhesin domain-containing protein n=1 Tax=Marasmius crinis-equi TaxID=585013 RepID=A0ABR3FHI9_9AGAR